MKPLSKPELAMTEQEILDVLNRGGYGVLGVQGLDQYVYQIPLHFWYFGDSIYFHTGQGGEKFACWEKHPLVSFLVVEDVVLIPDRFDTRFYSVLIRGEVKEAKGEEKIRALRGLIRKYSPAFLEKGEEYIRRSGGETRVMKIIIRHQSGKKRNR